jgi:hypothetical protein
MLTHARLLSVLHYELPTGIFTWRVNLGRRYVAGRRAGNVNKVHGYLHIRVDGKLYYASHLAWFCVCGIWPNKQLNDDRICNLRLATIINLG